MKVSRTKISDVLLLEPRKFSDARGYFLETWSRARYADLGIEADFVQDNLSRSHQNVLRGLHFQNPSPQAKLVSVIRGAVFDVAVDLRIASSTFGQWVGEHLTAENHRQMYVPIGFAHGFVVTSGDAMFAYKCTAPYAPSHEHHLLWNDPDVDIDWPVDLPLVSEKDAAAPRLRDLTHSCLFRAAGALP